jgi:hypothetical protein
MPRGRGCPCFSLKLDRIERSPIDSTLRRISRAAVAVVVPLARLGPRCVQARLGLWNVRCMTVALDGRVTRAGVLVSVKGNFPGNGRAST